jgi:hypothetical protein
MLANADQRGRQGVVGPAQSQLAVYRLAANELRPSGDSRHAAFSIYLSSGSTWSATTSCVSGNFQAYGPTGYTRGLTALELEFWSSNGTKAGDQIMGQNSAVQYRRSSDSVWRDPIGITCTSGPTTGGLTGNFGGSAGSLTWTVTEGGAVGACA